MLTLVSQGSLPRHFVLLSEYSVLRLSANPPMIGTRHLAQLKTLLSLVFKWSIESEILTLWTALKPAPKFEELPDKPVAPKIENLASLMPRVFKMIFRLPPEPSEPSTSAQGAAEWSIAQTHITQTLVTRYATDILRPAVFLGWQERSKIDDQGMKDHLDYIKSCTIRFLNLCVV